MQQGEKISVGDKCVVRFQEVLHDHGGRFTEERRDLLAAIFGMEGHFTPEEVALHARVKGHRIATTTVYRNLPLLLEAGILRRAPGAHGNATRYEVAWEKEHHDHLSCSRCGKQVEFVNPAIEVLQDAVAKEHGFVLERHHHELVGICADCRARLEPAQ